MLLLHQTGSVKIGEVVRYTVTYTPANDRILPAPSHLFLRIRNSSTVALRAAFIHGPYTLYVSSAPANFRANEHFDNPRRDGVPEFEPMLKAGGTWLSKLSVPQDIRDTAGTAQSRDDGSQKSVSWIIEVASQVIFSTSAAVHYEILLARDEKSLSSGFLGNNSAHGIPGQISDHQQSQGAKDGHHNAQQKGVFSRAIKVGVDDTASLWNKPSFPEWDDHKEAEAEKHTADAPTDKAVPDGPKPDKHSGKRQKKVHLVVLTHGLHSNLGADMLYMKESIDEAVIQAKADAKERRRKRAKNDRSDSKHTADHKEDGTDEDEDDEEVIVRGFSGNAVRTEKGIKYLGKRMAKYVLSMTYPDQPFRPITRTAAQSISAAIKNDKDEHGLPIHANSTIREEPYTDKKLAYKITSISFIAHSLGGLIQTYAVAYIQKHSPQFFDLIKPINFVAMATPFLGLSNENPLYVKFALDFGLVGRTGQDLGLTWRAPTIARNGWSALVSGIGDGAHKKLETERDPGAKPLLRILPTGPAHVALKKFRNRTVYSNVVNDGIVPLRTSCLLFLDWSGLGKVEKARRENGLVGTMAGWGWAELTGANVGSSRKSWSEDHRDTDGESNNGANTPTRQGKGGEVPQPAEDATDDDARSLKSLHGNMGTFPSAPGSTFGDEDNVLPAPSPTTITAHNGGAIESILGMFRLSPTPKSHNHVPKQKMIYRRSQTIKLTQDDSKDSSSGVRSKATSGEEPEDSTPAAAPPRTTFFEAAGDLLAPPIPPVDFLIDPSSRPRTIFHDRVYHPDDIPAPPVKRASTSLLGLRKSSSSTVHTLDSPLSPTSPSIPSSSNSFSDEAAIQVDSSAMKVEEKIARAYHRDLAWRKVLVRLEPDAHNNMIVRRRFANAYGWPVIKHLCDTHFSDGEAANTRDDEEGNEDRAKESNEAPSKSGGELKGDDLRHDDDDFQIRPLKRQDRTDSEVRESADSVPALNSTRPGNLARVLNAANSSADGRSISYRDRQDSAQWSDRDFADSEDDSDYERDLLKGSSSPPGGLSPRLPPKIITPGKARGWNWTEAIVGRSAGVGLKSPRSPRGTMEDDIDAFLAYRGADAGKSGVADDAPAAPAAKTDGAGTAAAGVATAGKGSSNVQASGSPTVTVTAAREEV